MIKKMVPVEFPDPRITTEEGIVALGGDLSAAMLLSAYRKGIFPWPISGMPLPWFCPPRRALLIFDHLHIPASLKRQRNRAKFHFTIDQDFAGVIQGCAQASRPGQDGTWITSRMRKAYIELHALGHAHSVEAWEGEVLVGGLYGVDAGGAFAAESMFYSRPYASKLALLYLLDHLRDRGLNWIDIQTMTSHMEAIGAVEEDREEFLVRLERALELGLELFPPSSP